MMIANGYTATNIGAFVGGSLYFKDYDLLLFGLGIFAVTIIVVYSGVRFGRRRKERTGEA